MITCSLLVDGVVEDFFVSFVYAANIAEDRRELWADIQRHSEDPMFHNKPWLIMGDFNETLDGEEHSGFAVSPSITSGMRDFQDTVRCCSLVDMSYHGPMFTWCNKRDAWLISKKLDRVLINEVWNQSFSESYSVFESGGCSDHLRCRFKLRNEARRPRGPFKFSNVLMTSLEFMSTVREFWDNTNALYHSTSALFRFGKKTESSKADSSFFGQKEATSHLFTCRRSA